MSERTRIENLLESGGHKIAEPVILCPECGANVGGWRVGEGEFMECHCCHRELTVVEVEGELRAITLEEYERRLDQESY